MGAATARVLRLARVFVPPHVRAVGGKIVHVDGYWREGGAGSVEVARSEAHIPPPAQEVPARSAPVYRLSEAVTMVDQRKAGKAKITVDAAAMDRAAKAAGVRAVPGLEIRLRLRDQKTPGEQGVMQQIGPNAYRVIVKVAPKSKLEERHLYVLNNSLVHELRHVAQAQKEGTGFNMKYAMGTQMFGYTKNPFEVEARFYGRLADHKGVKDTGPAGPRLGKEVWGLVSA